MTELYKELLKLVSSVLPLLWLCFALISRVTKPYLACIISLLLTILGAIFFWETPINILCWNLLDGFISSLYPIVWTIFSALFTYRLICEVGAIEGIKRTLSGLSERKIIQALIIAFCFGGLLEGIAGFGTSVIIPSAILLSLGFSPYQSAIVSLLSNTVPVAYAAIGVPIIALARSTNLPLKNLSGIVGLQLFPITLIIPLFIKRVMKESANIFFLLGTGAVFAIIQSLVSWYVGPELPAVLAPFFTIGFLIFYLRLIEKEDSNKKILREDLKSWIPYGLIIIFILITRFSNSINKALTSYPFSFILNLKPIDKSIRIDPLYTPGTIIILSAVIGGLLLKAKSRDYKKAISETLLQILPTLSIITSMMAMANIMSYIGMTKLLAIRLIQVFGSFYPFVSPFLGAVGTFLGGSDTTSNILFGPLQVEASKNLGVSTVWLASANASGATGGKLVSIQNLTLAASGINKKGEEGNLMRFIFPYTLLYLIVMGLTIYIGAKISTYP
ncbi:MAG: L-lactate permease [bacterium]|nr:L-lactate permease [bacterium]